MSVKIYVRDNTNGKVHEYGTIYPDEGYTFCEADGSDPRTREDYIQYGIEPYIDIGGKGEDHTCAPCKWISVKDRLPEEDENYIVTACDEGCSAGEGIWYSTVVVVAEYYKGSWTWYDGGSEYSLEGIVTHWMPLPEPPEMEKTEE